MNRVCKHPSCHLCFQDHCNFCKKIDKCSNCNKKEYVWKLKDCKHYAYLEFFNKKCSSCYKLKSKSVFNLKNIKNCKSCKKNTLLNDTLRCGHSLCADYSSYGCKICKTSRNSVEINNEISFCPVCNNIALLLNIKKCGHKLCQICSRKQCFICDLEYSNELKNGIFKVFI